MSGPQPPRRLLVVAVLGALACSGGGATSGRGGGGGASGSGGSGPGVGGGSGAGGAGEGGAGAAGAGGNGMDAAAGSGFDGAGVDAPRGPVVPPPGSTLVKVDPAARRQTFEGWGSSLCWWANRVGGWDAAARNAVVDAIVDPIAGLGYNLFRYNIGGGENPAHEHMGRFREMPGFAPSAGTWTWDADANQRAILQRLVERGGTGVILEAFSNSPPYWMTKSGCASGNTDGSNNLKDDSYDAFADYLTEVVKHYRDSFGIVFRTLEPLNESTSTWWTANGSQEGCHFNRSNQQQILKAVGASLAAKGLTGTAVSATDDNSIDETNDNLRAYDATTLGYLAQVNTHSYSGSARASLRAQVTSRGKRLWQSESGPLNVTLADNTESAMFMAGRIISDLRDLQPEAWLDWQVVDTGGVWATIGVNDTQRSWTPLKRFYMHAGFSRFIRPGATMLALDGPDMVAALAAGGSTLAIVVRNGDTAAARSFTFDLTALPSVGAQVAVYRTSRTENLATLPPLAVQGWGVTVEAAPYSVTTLVVTVGP